MKVATTTGQTSGASSEPSKPHLGIRIAIVIALAFGVAVNLVGFPGVRDLGIKYRIDLDVYRIGASVWRSGADLYGPMPLTSGGIGLPFTYPPLSAVVFAPFTFVSLSIASLLITISSIVMLAVTVGIWLRSLRSGPAPSLAARTPLLWTGAAILAVALWLEPVVSSLNYGQVNIVLMALVAADCLLKKTPWPRGMLIGLVTAIKLTPAVFVLYFLIRRDFRAAIVSGLSFLLFTGIGVAFAPKDSLTYWFSTLVNSGRIGNPMYAANQSITGLLARFGMPDDIRSLVWIGLSGLTVILAAFAMWRAHEAKQPALTLGLAALLGLLISPVSWSHHWVWAVPVLISLAAFAYTHRLRRFGVLAGLGLVVFAAGVHWHLGSGHNLEIAWPLWGQILGSSYLWWALAVIITVAVAPPRTASAAADQAETRKPAVEDGRQIIV
ncbi:glycosyltransferase 87 family protein [Tomitella biformata]|uniref:glycosyltransferase 87 family protein n=1 Tax=Tomitella biformata TaxID=630403 RepID=UPI000466311C|nr:glycosyltransferase 87 family protein [Tomitella biformata]